MTELTAHRTTLGVTGHELSQSVGGPFDTNQTRTRFWWRDLEVEIFRPGEQDIALGVAAAYKKELFKLECPFLQFKGTGSIAGFDLFPEGNFSDRNVLGIGSGLDFFLGSKQRAGIVEFREGLEVGTSFFWGKNLSAVLTAPITLGATIGVHLPGESSIWLSGSIENYIAMADVQDAGSIFPFFNKGEISLAAHSPNIEVDLSLDLYFNGTKSIHGTITYPLDEPFGIPVHGFAGIEGGFDLSGGDPNNWVMQSGQYLGFAIGIDFGLTKDDEIGLSVRTAFSSSDSPDYSYESGDVIAPANPYPTPIDKTLACGPAKQSHGDTYMNCSWAMGYEGPTDENGALTCYPGTDNSLNCFVNGSEVFFKADKIADPSADDYFDFFKVGGMGSANPQIDAILGSAALDQLVAAGASMGEHEQVVLLNHLAELGYKTYDDQALLIANGTGQTNTISEEDIYSNLRETYINPDSKKPTTVCRGFAKFITYVADKWNFEAHAVTIQTAKSGHVITVLRKKGSADGYYVINYGDGPIYKSTDRDISKVVQDYCAKNGYPPQLQNWVFGPDGSPEGVIETATFKMLKEATLPKPELEDFLRGR